MTDAVMDTKELAKLARALANPLREEAVRRALTFEFVTQANIRADFRLSERTVHDHFKTLIEAGVLYERKSTEGKTYHVRDEIRDSVERLVTGRSGPRPPAVWRVYDDDDKTYPFADWINNALRKDDTAYYLYGEEEVRYLHGWVLGKPSFGAGPSPKELKKRGIDLRILTSVTHKNLREISSLKQYFKIRHCDENIFNLRLILKGRRHVFLWFTKMAPEGVHGRSICTWFSGDDTFSAFHSVFEKLWERSIPLMDRVKVLLNEQDRMEGRKK